MLHTAVGHRKECSQCGDAQILIQMNHKHQIIFDEIKLVNAPHTLHRRFLRKYFLFYFHYNETCVNGENRTIDSHSLIQCRATWWTFVSSSLPLTLSYTKFVSASTIYFHNTHKNKNEKEMFGVVRCWLFQSVFVLFKLSKRITSLTEQWPMCSNNFRFSHFYSILL